MGYRFFDFVFSLLAAFVIVMVGQWVVLTGWNYVAPGWGRIAVFLALLLYFWRPWKKRQHQHNAGNNDLFPGM